MRTLSLNHMRRVALIVVAAALTATTAQAAARMFRGNVAPGATKWHSVTIGYDDDYVVVQGDSRSADADLDCWIYQDGVLIDSDTDRTDNCVLSTPGMGTHELRIKNFGSLTNFYNVTSR
jgi:hypothetical protein